MRVKCIDFVNKPINDENRYSIAHGGYTTDYIFKK